ncbi:multidrug MFS transporter [Caulobacter sp. Root655]|uniref:MDR family MFS transporter n=1 Tax=Caulobacter sp. Root655 TaxID=1736578 RepID=UPI0006F7C5AA|nr:MDR family MFS transporter [Caulobacter sp. Root655]KRA61832.1 multidrug MFS transporter [Caulobacter sp. Root655]
MTTTQTFTDTERRLTLGALMIVFLLSALDQTVVSTAMPRIIAELNGLTLYAWVTTAYLLTSTVMVPIWGKLGDIYGRKPVLLWGIGIFLAGSWLSGLSGEFGTVLGMGGMVQLIVFRALQGIGGGALFTTAFAIIADLYPPRERGKFAGIFGSVFGLASVLGPLIGGYFTDHGTVHIAGHLVAGWRWVFYVNLPLSVLSLFMILVKMPALEHRRFGSVDYLGAALLVAAFVPLLLALSLGGHSFAWSSPRSLGLFAGAAVALVLFILAERKVSNPIVPLALFRNRVFTTANLAGFLISMAFLGVVTFLPLYMQLGMGVDATTSGLAILPLMGGLIVSSTIAGQLVSRVGRYKPLMITGAGLLMVGVWLLSRVSVHTTLPDLCWRMAIVGLGLGPGQSLFGLAAQNAVEPRDIGVATSSNQFFRQIGSTIGVALFGALLTHRLASLGQGADLGALQGMALKATASGAHHAADPTLSLALTHAITGVFLAGLAVIGAGLVVILFIPELPLRSRQPAGAPALEKEPA